MKLAICGDSWASTNDDDGTSFGEILCTLNNWELMNFARPGSSNFAICLQIDQAINEKADFIIISTTSSTRVEFPLKGKSYSKDKLLSNVAHVCTSHSNSFSKKFAVNPTIVSDTIGNFNLFEKNIGCEYHKILPETFKESLKYYLNDLFDNKIKLQYDTWIISDSCRRVINSNIPFLIIIDRLYSGFNTHAPFEEFLSDITWIPDYNLIHYNDFAYHRDLDIDNIKMYHYSEDSSSKFADYISTRIKNILDHRI